MSIRLSEKHGVNPTVGICYWCGQDDGTIALLGRLPQDREASHKTVLSYEPCTACKDMWVQGITLIEVEEWPVGEGQPPINATRHNKVPHDAIYPTGRWCVMTEEAFQRVFSGPEIEATLKHRKAYIQREVYEYLDLARDLDSNGKEVEA